MHVVLISVTSEYFWVLIKNTVGFSDIGGITLHPVCRHFGGVSVNKGDLKGLLMTGLCRLQFSSLLAIKRVVLSHVLTKKKGRGDKAGLDQSSQRSYMSALCMNQVNLL